MIPNNATDLIQSIKDGEVGIINTIMIGDLLVSALFGLDAAQSLTLTNRKIQFGSDMATMAIDDRNPISMDICLSNPEISLDSALQSAISGSAEIFTETWRDKKDQLNKLMSNREVVDVQTHDDIYYSYLITAIYPIFNVEENWDAFICSVTLEKVTLYGQETENNSILTTSKQIVSGL